MRNVHDAAAPRLGWVFAVGLSLGLFAACTGVDLDTARAYPCEAETEGADGQCPEGWRCGLDGRCHDTTVAADYLCRTDEHCEEGWRCGADGRCVAPSSSLRGNASLGTPTVSRLSPALPAEMPKALALSRRFRSPETCDNTVYVVASAYDGGLQQLVFYPDSFRISEPDGGFLAECPDDDFEELPLHRVQMDRQTVALSGTTVDLAVHDARIFQLRDDGQLCSFTGLPPQGLTAAGCLPVGFPAKKLSVSAGPGQLNGVVVARDDTRYATFFIDANTSTVTAGFAGNVKGADGGVRTIEQMVGIHGYNGGGDYLLAATPYGLFLRGLDAEGVTGLVDAGVIGKGKWDPVRAAHSNWPCDERDDERFYYPSAVHVLEADTFQQELLVEELVGSKTPESMQRRLTKISVTPPPSSVLPTEETCGLLPMPQRAGSGGLQFFWANVSGGCGTACYEGGVFQSVEARRGQMPGEVYLEAMCLEPTGEPKYLYVETEDMCRSYDPPDMAPYSPFLVPHVAATSLPGREAFADADGHVWTTDDGENLGKIALFPDRAVLGVTGGDRGLSAFAPRTGHNYDDSNILYNPNIQAESWRLTPGMGLVQGAGDLSQIAFSDGMEGNRYASILYGLDEQTMQSFALAAQLEPRLGAVALFPSNDTFTPPFHGSVFDLPDAGQVMVATSFDTLLSGELGNILSTGGSEIDQLNVPRLEVRITPSSRTPITSLTVWRPEPDAQGKQLYAEGYVVSGRRPYRLRATTPTVWLTDVLSLEDGESLEVWNDEKRPRLGLTDGRIYGLPDLIALAPKLPDDAGLVRDFAHRCSHNFALTEKGLYWLQVPDGEPQGTWTRVELDGVSPGATSRLSGGRLYVTESAVLLFLVNGDVLSVSGLSCPSTG